MPVQARCGWTLEFLGRGKPTLTAVLPYMGFYKPVCGPYALAHCNFPLLGLEEGILWAPHSVVPRWALYFSSVLRLTVGCQLFGSSSNKSSFFHCVYLHVALVQEGEMHSWPDKCLWCLAKSWQGDIIALGLLHLTVPDVVHFKSFAA